MKPYDEAWRLTITPSRNASKMADSWPGESMSLYFDRFPTKENVLLAIDEEVVAEYGGPPSCTDLGRPEEEAREQASMEFHDACRAMVLKSDVPTRQEVDNSMVREMSISNAMGCIRADLLRLYLV